MIVGFIPFFEAQELRLREEEVEFQLGEEASLRFAPPLKVRFGSNPLGRPPFRTLSPQKAPSFLRLSRWQADNMRCKKKKTQAPISQRDESPTPLFRAQDRTTGLSILQTKDYQETAPDSSQPSVIHLAVWPPFIAHDNALRKGA